MNEMKNENCKVKSADEDEKEQGARNQTTGNNNIHHKQVAFPTDNNMNEH